MHPVNVLDAVMHLNRNLLPREEAQITLLQQGLQFNIRNGLYCGHDFLFKFHQILDVVFQAFLNLDNLQNGPFYFGASTIWVSGHVAVNDGAGCGQFI